MDYEIKKTLEQFDKYMVDFARINPEFHRAFIGEKSVVTKDGALPSRIKWLLILAASVSHHCPICIPRAVKQCLAAGWSKEEIVEAASAAVLVGGSATMTYATLVLKSIEELQD